MPIFFGYIIGTLAVDGWGGVQNDVHSSNLGGFYWIFATPGQNVYGHNISVKFCYQLDHYNYRYCRVMAFIVQSSAKLALSVLLSEVLIGSSQNL